MKQIKLKSKFRQVNSSLQMSRVGRLIRMLLGRADVLASNALLIVLVCLMAIGVCCMGPGESNQLKLTGANPETSGQRNNPNDKQSLLILLSALREFCSNDPLECQSDRSLDNCLIAGGRLVCDQIASTTPARGSTSTTNGNSGGNDKGEQQSDNEMSSENRTKFSSDELAESQFWLPKLTSVAAECNVSLQNDQLEQAMKARERILNMLAGYETLEVLTSRSWTGDRKKATDRLKRNQVVNGRQAARDNTYKVTLNQAKRLIRAHQRQQNGLLAPMTGPIMLATSPGDLLIVPKRTDSVSSSSSDEIGPESGIKRAKSGDENSATISTMTSGHQLVQLDELGLKLAAAATSKPPDAGEVSNNEDALKCNMRRFIYRATKTDRAGNQCTGLITASICYGACDTGEIADWLFPYRKSIHKVCRHGRRIRRKTRLTDCTTSSGAALALDDDDLDDLLQYHYVDALDCACKRCTSADTTCLGTMSTPHLQTLGEIGQSNHNQNHNRHHQQQQLMMTSSGDD